MPLNKFIWSDSKYFYSNSELRILLVIFPTLSFVIDLLLSLVKFQFNNFEDFSDWCLFNDYYDENGFEKC